jgi:hypothetical protein
MCNLYSMTKNVDAIGRLFGALNSRVGNLPSMPGPRRGLGLSQIGRQVPALLSFTFLDLKCGSASSRSVPPV